jgi:NMD protein affecting ribosome stability and mRNA decay
VIEVCITDEKEIVVIESVFELVYCGHGGPFIWWHKNIEERINEEISFMKSEALIRKQMELNNISFTRQKIYRDLVNQKISGVDACTQLTKLGNLEIKVDTFRCEEG